MRILVVSNLYPPYHIGGYERCCQEAVDGLRKRGHEVWVLTSDYGIKRPEKERDIFRALAIDLGPGGSHFGGRPAGALARTVGLLRKEVRNFRAFRRITKAFGPDVVYLWNLTHISVSVGMQAANMGLPTCYYVGDLWLSKWRSDSWLSLGAGTFPAVDSRPRRFVSGLARLVFKGSGLGYAGSLDLRHVQFASAYLKSETAEAGEPVTKGEVLHWGVDLRELPFKPNGGRPARMLCVGQVVPHKGLDTAVEALRILALSEECALLKLTIAGGSVYPDYISQLREKVRLSSLEGNVEFVGVVSREELPRLYREHDILLFPSVIDEGLGLSILEAMAAGLVVVGTASGGSGEILIHDRTGLVFPKEDASTCAAHVLRLLNDSSLFESLRRGGRRAVEDYFEIGRLLDDMEHSLKGTLESRGVGGFR